MAKESKETQQKLPPVDFTTFISELAMTASAYLGGMQNPETKQPMVDLDMAKRMVDTIELLQEKTKGNLTTPESNFLSNTLYNLRMSYVRLKANPPPKQSEEVSVSE